MSFPPELIVTLLACLPFIALVMFLLVVQVTKGDNQNG